MFGDCDIARSQDGLSCVFSLIAVSEGWVMGAFAVVADEPEDFAEEHATEMHMIKRQIKNHDFMTRIMP